VDPLEDILTLLDARSRLSSRFTVGAEPWRVDFAQPDGVKFNAVLAGHCLLAVQGLEPVVIGTGDCFLLTRPVPFTLASDLAAPSVRAAEVFTGSGQSAVVNPGPPGEPAVFTALGGSFEFSGPATRLLDELPPVLIVPSDASASGTVAEALDVVDRELREGLPGAPVVAQHMAIVSLVRLVRWFLDQGSDLRRGWLRGLLDPAVAAALSAIHGSPEQPWTVAELAGVACVSRSTLAERFTHAVGVGPIEYLLGWRMELAARRLARGEDSVASIARDLGYSSESAFSTAFQRVRGVRPSIHRRLNGCPAERHP